ncbi:MAG: glycosyltransferase, partial [Candidatus Latescibacterota bacterium]
IASTLGIGGAENVMSNLLTRLPAETTESRTYLLREPGPIGDKLIRSGIWCEHGLGRHRADPTVLARLVPRLRSFSPDIVFTLDHHNAMFWGRLASLVAGVPRRVAVSHSTGRMDNERSFTALDRVLMRQTDVVVALSDAHAGYLRDIEHIDGDKIEIIENGIDIELYSRVDEHTVSSTRLGLGIGDDGSVVTMVAAIRPEKAHDALLEASRIIITERPDLSLTYLIVGDGPARVELEAKRSRLGLDGSVNFLGSREDVPVILGLSDVLVLPSHAAVETLPLAVLEAMAAGVAIVASAVGSVPEIIQDGWNGKLIAPADAVGLSKAICHIVDNQRETERMIENARETVRRRYSVEHMVAKYQTLFERIAR